MRVAQALKEHFVIFREARIFVSQTETGMIAMMYRQRGHIILRRLTIPRIVELFEAHHDQMLENLAEELYNDIIKANNEEETV